MLLTNKRAVDRYKATSERIRNVLACWKCKGW